MSDVVRLATGDDEGQHSAEQAEGEEGCGSLPMAALGAELFHGIDGSGGGEAGEEKGEPVEGMLFFGADVFDQDEREHEGDDAEGKIEEEDPVPACVGGDEAAEGRAEDESGEAGPGDVVDGLGEVVLGRVAQDDEAADGHHHGSADALQDAREGELGEVVAEAAEE